MSIASELSHLTLNKSAIKAAIEAKCPRIPPTNALSQWPKSIMSITFPDNDWTKPGDWPDITQILKDDITPATAISAGATHKWIMLCNPGPPGNGVDNYTFYSPTVYLRISDGETTVEQSSMTVTPFNSGKLFWIIAYSSSDRVYTPAPRDSPYNVVGPLWVHAPDMEYYAQNWSMSGWKCMQKATFRTYSGPHNNYDRQFFNACFSLASIEIREPPETYTWGGTSANSAFNDCGQIRKIDVSGWNMGNVVNMQSMFNGCRSLREIDVSNWDVGKVTNMSYMFQNMTLVTKLDVSKWNTSNVTTMYSLFTGCTSLRELDVSNWDVGKVTNMFCMFTNLISLPHLDMSKWNTSNVTTFYQMFNNCCYLTGEMDISNWDTSKLTNAQYMFNSCSQLERIILPKLSNVYLNMFANCGKCVLYDFRKCTSVPTLDNVNAFTGINTNAHIVVPDALYSDWVSASNWSNSAIAPHIISSTDYENL